MTAKHPCAVCGEAAVDDHHLTGRAPDHQYLDADLVAPLCHDDHELAHEDLRNAGIDTPPRGMWSALQSVEFCLERSALFLARIGEHTGQGLWSRLAGAMRRWADQLRDHRLWLDLALPGWEHPPTREVNA